MVCRFAPVWSLLQWTVCTEEQRCPSIHWCSLVTHILRNISTSLVDNNAGDQYKSIIGFSSCKIRYTKVTIFLKSWPLTNGVLGLHAEKKGGGEVVDFVHAGLVLLAAWMKYFKIEDKSKADAGFVPYPGSPAQGLRAAKRSDARWPQNPEESFSPNKLYRLVRWPIRRSLILNVILLWFSCFPSGARGNDEKALLGCFGGSTESLMCFSPSMKMMKWPFFLNIEKYEFKLISSSKIIRWVETHG